MTSNRTIEFDVVVTSRATVTGDPEFDAAYERVADPTIVLDALKARSVVVCDVVAPLTYPAHTRTRACGDPKLPAMGVAQNSHPGESAGAMKFGSDLAMNASLMVYTPLPVKVTPRAAY